MSKALKLLAATLLLVAIQPLQAQQYPVKPVRVIVPFAPGGGSDLTARQFSAKLAALLGQQFVVDNRGGAGGIIGMEAVAKAPPDGYTIMMMSGSFSASSATHKPAFDPINSIIPVAEFGITPFVVTVHPSLPPKNLKALIALARARPGDLTYASSGVGGLTHLATELLSLMANIRMVHVPYKSTGAAMTDLLSGQAPIIVGSLLPVVPHFKSGRLRPLAVTTAQRWHSLPEVPAVAETLPGYEVELWFGAMAPRGTPQAAIDRLNAGINQALQDPEMKRNLEGQGMIQTGGTPQKFGERIQRDYQRWSKVVSEAKISVK
ncbi:MAG: tripartite tricarboxylate transporter substrate binding protein [Burkholderiales bacterium]|jgi:tripartite-type tricarboxylate transporter receptor subunit TctC|nr:tripartite tricarboxylate transporter substrate binding protein [Burkholderiales bacterium]